MPAALPAVAAWAAAAWSSAVTVTAVGLTKVGVMAAIGEGATIALAGKIVGAAATMALSAGAAALMRPNTPSTGTTLDFKPDPKAPVRGVMGYAAVGGSKVFQATWGYKKVAMSLGVALSLGPIDQVTQFRADDAVVTFAGPQNEATGFYAADMWQRTTTGLPSDAALLPPTGLKYGNPGLTGWGSQNAAPGVSFAFWTMVLAKNPEDRDIFTNGVPDPRWVGRWMKVWDPRKDSTYPGGSGPQRRDDWRTWAWSENPYAHALAWVRGHYKLNLDGTLDRTKRIAGIGAPDAAIDLPAFIEGLNVADANSWTISGEWSTSDGKFQTLVAMLQAGGGEPISRGAKISVMVNGPRVATYTYTRDDLIGAGEVRTSTPRRERKNTIIPRYRSEAHGWEYVPAGEVTSSVYRSEDRGEPRSIEIEYVHVRDAKQAGQLAAYDLANLREGLTATLPSKAHLMHVHPGDCILVDVPELALASQKFLVRRATANHQSASVTLELRAESDGKHAWALGQIANPPPSPSLSAVDPKYVDPPLGDDWVIEPRPPAPDGTSQPVIVITGLVGTGDIAEIIIEYGRAPDGPWTVGYSGPPMTNGRYEITGMVPEAEYWVSVRYVTKNGTISDRTLMGPVTTGGLIAGDLKPESPAWDAILDLIGTGGGGAIVEAEQRMAAALAAAEARLDAADAALSVAIDSLGLDDIEGFADYRTATETLINGKASLTVVGALQTQTDNLLSRIVTAETTLTDLPNQYVSTTSFGLLQAQADGLSGRLTTAETAIADLPNQFASAGSLQALSSEVAGARDGKVNLAARLLADRQTVADGLAGKVSVTDFNSLSATVSGQGVTVGGLASRLTSVETGLSGKVSTTDFNTLSATVSTQGTSISGALSRLNTVEADVAGKASASSVTTLTTTVNGYSASITSAQQVAAAADGKANSIVGIVQDVNGKATGFASVNNGTTSSFDVRSDKFTVSSPSGGARTEFSSGTWRIYDGNNRLRVRMGVW